MSFQNKYNIYRTLRFIEKMGISLDDKNNSIVEYKKNIQDFKNLIKHLAFSYYEFFSLLLASKSQNSNNFNKIYKIGTEIMKDNPKLDDLYDKLMLVKTDNIEIIRLYSEYAEGILYNDEKLEKCYNDSKLSYNKTEIHEKKFSEFDVGIFNEKQNMTFMIVSAKKDQLGKIIDFSMNVSKIFGYSKEELLGKHINILIPKIFQESHDLITMEEYEKNKLKLFDYLNKKKEYFPDFIKKNVYGISKLKFLIELNLNIYFVKTEDNSLSYVIEILNSNPLMIDLTKNINIDLKFCVLTDDNFLIQSFTPNCLEFLKLDYSFINSNISIINFIKQFQDEYLNALNNTAMTKYSSFAYKSEISEEKHGDLKAIKNSKIPKNSKKKLKNDLFIKNYSKKCKIIWNINEEENNFKKSTFRNKSICISENDCKSSIFAKSQNQETGISMYMEIEKIIIKKQLLGYYFFFSKIKKKNYKNISYILGNDGSKDNNNYSAKIKKYQCKFDSKLSSFILEDKKYNDSKKMESLRLPRKENIELQKEIKAIYQNKSEVNNSVISKNLQSDQIKMDNFVITGDFIPNDSSNFSLNLNNFYFVQESENKDSTGFINTLKDEADNKIKIYQEQLKLLSKNSEEEDQEESEEIESDELSELKEENSSVVNSSYSIKPQKSKAESKRNELSSKNIQKVSNKMVQQNDNNNTNNTNNNDDLNSTINKKRIQNKNSIINKYYKVNLNKVHYMIFNFDKDMIVEGNKDHKVCKVEKIMTKIKNEKEPIFHEKDDKFSYLSLFKIKKNKNKNRENQNDTEKNNSNEYNYQIDKEKIFKTKLYEALNNQKNEPPIIKLKILLTISIFIMASIGFIILFIDLGFLDSMKITLSLINDSIVIKYCSQMSIYYLRELTLLNFNALDIKGGTYDKIPDNNFENYKNLILSELIELFIESESSVKNLYSTSISLPKQESQLMSEFEIEVKLSNNPVIFMKYDILTSLMQYSSTFHNLAVSTDTNTITQGYTDVYNFIYNNLNGYKEVINFLIEIYSNKLSAISNSVLVIGVIASIIIFIIFATFFILLIIYSKASILCRNNYMNVFYGVNENILKNITNNCENLINKLKTSEEQKYYEEDTLEASINDNIYSENNQKKLIQKHTFSQKKSLNYNIDNNKKTVKANMKENLIIIIYTIAILISYCYFIFICVYMIIISKKSLFLFNYSNKLQNHQLEIINFFNVYREFLFDDQSIINGTTSLQYLIKAEKEYLLKLNSDIKVIKAYKDKYFPKDDKTLCHYYKTQIFDSSIDCMDKIGLITNYDFSTLSNFFIEEIKIDKKIVVYKLTKEKNIVGNLTSYNISDYSNDPDIPKNDDDSGNNNTFRLDLFNDETLHYNLNLIFFNIILPYIDEIRKIIPNVLRLGRLERFLTIACLTFELQLIITILFYLIPVINYINNIINKTKKMLSIIPLNILASQNGISMLLNISNES